MRYKGKKKMVKAINEKRIEYIDIIRGLAIITVVVGHASTRIDSFVALFHVQVFFFISGYLYKEKYNHNIRLFIKKKIKALYIPFIKYSLIFILLHNVFYELHFYSDKVNLFQSILHTFLFDCSEYLLIPFWFLPSLFVSSILFCLISSFSTHCKNGNLIKSILVFIVFCTGLLFTRLGIVNKVSYWGQETINVSLVSTVFIYIGNLFKQHESEIHFSTIGFLISFAVLIISTKVNIHVNMRINSYSDIVMMVINSSLGIYLLIALSKSLQKNRLSNNVFSYIGQNTIIIMALHLLFFKIVGYIQMIKFNLPIKALSNFAVATHKQYWWMLYSIVGIGLPLLIHYMYQRCKNLFKQGRA